MATRRAIENLPQLILSDLCKLGKMNIVIDSDRSIEGDFAVNLGFSELFLKAGFYGEISKSTVILSFLLFLFRSPFISFTAYSKTPDGVPLYPCYKATFLNIASPFWGRGLVLHATL